MNSNEPIVMYIKTKEDIEKLKKIPTIKYINLDITNPDQEIIKYFLENGQNYSYAETIDKRPGYIYIDYATFKLGQTIIDHAIANIDPKLTKLEKARAIYIYLGKELGYDINSYPEKNEDFNLTNLSTINNIWGAISNKKITNISLSKLYYYLCHLMNISCEIITINEAGRLANKLMINNATIIVDLMEDLPFIQANMKTTSFGSYNDDHELDKKVGYISEEYSDLNLDNTLKKINCSEGKVLGEILTQTQSILPVRDIRPIELSIVYQEIFDKYFPNYDITINNLYINNIYNHKEHFILFSYQDEHYSFNYAQNSFILITNEELLQNIETKKIGLYLDEEVPALTSYRLKSA